MKTVLTTLLFSIAGMCFLSAQNNPIWGFGSGSGFSNACQNIGYSINNTIWSFGTGSGYTNACQNIGYPVNNNIWGKGSGSGHTVNCANIGYPVSNSIWAFGNGSGWSNDCITPAVPLPVRVLSFKATLKHKQTVTLQWKVSSEINLYKYVVQRSYDMNEWTDVVTMKASSSFGGNYLAEDDVKATVRMVYYRLIPVDWDGSYNTMKYDVVHLDKTSQAIEYNNPVNGMLRVTVPQQVQTSMTIELYTLQGVLVYQSLQQSATSLLDLSSLPASCYIMQVTVDKEPVGRFKVIKE